LAVGILAINGEEDVNDIAVLQQVKFTRSTPRQRRVAECDEPLQQHLARFAHTVPPQAKEEALQKEKPPTTNRIRQKEGRPTRPTDKRNPCLKRSSKKFLSQSRHRKREISMDL
jgi:hypothetical protein